MFGIPTFEVHDINEFVHSAQQPTQSLEIESNFLSAVSQLRLTDDHLKINEKLQFKHTDHGLRQCLCFQYIIMEPVMSIIL